MAELCSDGHTHITVSSHKTGTGRLDKDGTKLHSDFIKAEIIMIN